MVSTELQAVDLANNTIESIVEGSRSAADDLLSSVPDLTNVTIIDNLQVLALDAGDDPHAFALSEVSSDDLNLIL